LNNIIIGDKFIKKLIEAFKINITDEILFKNVGRNKII